MNLIVGEGLARLERRGGSSYLLPYLHYDSPGMAPLGVDEYDGFGFGISITMPPVGISPQLGETSLDYHRGQPPLVSMDFTGNKCAVRSLVSRLTTDSECDVDAFWR